MLQQAEFVQGEACLRWYFQANRLGQYAVRLLQQSVRLRYQSDHAASKRLQDDQKGGRDDGGDGPVHAVAARMSAALADAERKWRRRMKASAKKSNAGTSRAVDGASPKVRARSTTKTGCKIIHGTMLQRFVWTGKDNHRHVMMTLCPLTSFSPIVPIDP